MHSKLESAFGKIEESKWKKEAIERQKRRKSLKRSQAVALEVLEYLHRNKISQKDFAKRLSVTPQLVNKWLKGTENFTFETIEKIETAIGYDLIEVIDQNVKEKWEHNSMPKIKSEYLNIPELPAFKQTAKVVILYNNIYSNAIASRR